MKTIRQRLQSRISLRRNTIRELEADLVCLKQYKYHMNYIKDAISDYKEEIAFLALDQKLDRQLYAMLIEQDRNNRYFNDLSIDVLYNYVDSVTV
jgi:hypothetical protein